MLKFFSLVLLCTLSIYLLLQSSKSKPWCLLLLFQHFTLYFPFTINFLSLLSPLIFVIPKVLTSHLEISSVLTQRTLWWRRESFCSSVIFRICGSGNFSPAFRPVSVQLRRGIHQEWLGVKSWLLLDAVCLKHCVEISKSIRHQGYEYSLGMMNVIFSAHVSAWWCNCSCYLQRRD